ncbi:MAG: NAD(P)/FAD-dependent oxidoreductase, partial [Pyrobaculum sp.]
GWGALWQASTLARAIATEISKGVFELEAAPWSDVATREGFYRWLTYRMTSGTPLSHLKGLLDRWRGILNFLKEV